MGILFGPCYVDQTRIWYPYKIKWAMLRKGYMHLGVHEDDIW